MRLNKRNVLLLVLILVVTQAIYWAGVSIGYRQGEEEALASYRAERAYVEKNMRKVGICRWFEIAPEFYGCPNIEGKDKSE